MLKSISIKVRLLLGSGLCLSAVMAGIVSYSIYHMGETISMVRAEGEQALQDSAIKVLQASAQQQADAMQSRFLSAEVFARTLATQIVTIRGQANKLDLTPRQLRESLNHLLSAQVSGAPDILGAALAFNENALDGADGESVSIEPNIGNEIGRFAVYASTDGNFTFSEADLVNDCLLYTSDAADE